MIKKICLILISLLLMSCQSTSAQTIESEPLKERKFEDGINENYEPIDQAIIDGLIDFGTNTTSHLFEVENNIYSPLSYALALSMSVPFSQGETKEQLEEFLHHTQLNQDILQILEYHNDVGSMTLANSMWLQQGRNFNRDLLEGVANDYRASIYDVDFTNLSATKKQMNTWINDMTYNFIKDVDVGIEPTTVLSLINTIYLKDSWVVKFNKDLTQSQDFNTPNHVVTTDFMHSRDIEHYLHTQQYQILTKTLLNGSKVHFVLPTNDLDSLLNNDTMKDIHQQTHHTREALVDLSLPKFDISSNFELIELSKELGLTLPFDGSTAEFYPFEDDENVYISNIQQQARMAIDEDGIEAAAYTEISFDDSAAEIVDEVTLTFDKPFLVLVTSPHGIPLFWATVTDPSQ